MHPLIDLLANGRRWLGMSAVILALGALWIGVSAVPPQGTTGGRVPSPRTGFLAPSFELKDLQGNVVSLESQLGEVVVINFWASWCPPCRAEMPALQRAYVRYAERGLQVLAVNSTHQDSEAAAAAFAQERDLTFPVLLDEHGQVSNQYLTRALPTTFFVDREGVIQEVIIGGPISETTLRSIVESLLEADP